MRWCETSVLDNGWTMKHLHFVLFDSPRRNYHFVFRLSSYSPFSLTSLPRFIRPLYSLSPPLPSQPTPLSPSLHHFSPTRSGRNLGNLRKRKTNTRSLIRSIFIERLDQVVSWKTNNKPSCYDSLKVLILTRWIIIEHRYLPMDIHVDRDEHRGYLFLLLGSGYD